MECSVTNCFSQRIYKYGKYNGEGQIVNATGKDGHSTIYLLDASGNILEATSAMGKLIKSNLHGIDTQGNVDEWEIPLYEFDGRGLVTREVNALGATSPCIH